MLGGWKYSVTVMLGIIHASNPQAHLSSRTHRMLSYSLNGKHISRQLDDSAMMRSQVLNHQQHLEVHTEPWLCYSSKLIIYHCYLPVKSKEIS